jgi:hypothetical protein
MVAGRRTGFVSPDRQVCAQLEKPVLWRRIAFCFSIFAPYNKSKKKLKYCLQLIFPVIRYSHPLGHFNIHAK